MEHGREMIEEEVDEVHNSLILGIKKVEVVDINIAKPTNQVLILVTDRIICDNNLKSLPTSKQSAIR